MATVTERPTVTERHITEPSPGEPEVRAVVADDVLEGALDGEPVLEEGPGPQASVAPSLGAALAPVASPAVQAAAAAATGFVAGAATLALARRATGRRVARGALRRRSEALPILGTRSFLIDIHVLRPEE
jgi:hypothetical protein